MLIQVKALHPFKDLKHKHDENVAFAVFSASCG
jgi:hypothetical protein